MRTLNEKFKNLAMKIWKDESAQGMTEYILIVVAIVVVLSVFKGEFYKAIESSIANMTGKITNFINE